MTPHIEDIIKEVLALPRHQRLGLVRLLLDLDQPNTSDEVDHPMQIQNWNHELRTAVERRCAELSGNTAGPILRQAATAADGLPVYCDLGACLVIQKTGRVVMFDLDSESVRDLQDENWLLVALSSAAERYPEFQAIKPARPTLASDCSACAGVGRNPQFDLVCGVCMGLGWR